MSGSGRATAIVTGMVVALLGVGGPAFAADDTLHECMSELNVNGQLPTCTRVNGSWVPSWPDESGATGGGMGGTFAVLFIAALFLTALVIAWRVSMARQLATSAGLDPGLATQMTLLTDDGLDATYLAASLRQPPFTPAGSPPEPPLAATQARAALSAADRLTELRSLLDQGLVTPTEYDERRKAILDAV
jgi:hypothetical protein